MSSGNDNRVDWTAHGNPSGDRVGTGHSATGRQPAPAVNTRRSVMDTLLGENKLAAYDASGNDPYNTTGKFVRR
jgi:hypothetical protein